MFAHFASPFRVLFALSTVLQTAAEKWAAPKRRLSETYPLRPVQTLPAGVLVRCPLTGFLAVRMRSLYWFKAVIRRGPHSRNHFAAFAAVHFFGLVQLAQAVIF